MLIPTPLPETVLKHHQDQSKLHVHATVQLHNKVSSVYHRVLYHSPIETIRLIKISANSPSTSRTQLGDAFSSEFPEPALRPTGMQGVTNHTRRYSRFLFPSSKKALDTSPHQLHLPGATDHSSITHGGSTRQNFMGLSAELPPGSATQIRLCGLCLASVYMFTCFLDHTRFTASFTAFQGVIILRRSIDLENRVCMCTQSCLYAEKSSMKYVCSTLGRAVHVHLV